MRPTTVAFAVAAPFLLFGSAAAQTDEEAVIFEYRAPAMCENAAQFLARARARAPRMRLARPDERARLFVVDIEQRAGRMTGRLTVRNPEGRQTTREIEAKDCAEAVDALALIMALVVNPRAAETPPSASPRPTDAPGARGPDTPPAATSAPTADAPRAAPPAVPETDPGASSAPGRPPASNAPATPSAPAPPSSPEAPASSTSTGEAAQWAFRAGVSAWGVSAITPEPLVGGRGSGEWVYLANQAVAPSFRISAGYATRSGFVVDGGTAHFEYGGANLEICPLRWPAAGPLFLRPCAMADLGLIFARGADTLSPRGETRPWVALGAGARLEWALGRRVALDIDIGCTFPIWRDRFLFGSNAFHRVGLASGVVALGFVIRIP